MTKRTLVEKLSEAISAIEKGTLHPEVELTDSFIESIQEIQCRIEDGECYDNLDWDEDGIPDNIVDCIIEDIAKDYNMAALKVDMYTAAEALTNLRDIIVMRIIVGAIYNI